MTFLKVYVIINLIFYSYYPCFLTVELAIVTWKFRDSKILNIEIIAACQYFQPICADDCSRMEIKMNYPKKLSKHKTPNFSISEALLNVENKNIRAYYHNLSATYNPVIGMHSHDFYEVNIVLKGNPAHYLNDRIIVSPVGSVFVIPPHFQHGYYCEENSVIFKLVLSDKFFTTYFSHLYSLKNFHFIFTIEPSIRLKTDINLLLLLSDDELKYIYPILERLCQYDDKPQKQLFIAQEFLALNLIAEICTFSNNIINKQQETSYNIHAVIKAMDYINLHYNENIDLHALAKQCNVSYSTFFRTFKTLSHITPIEYLSKCRVEKAIEMIKKNTYSLTEIAQSCGFYDSSHFNKVFKALMGKSPKEWTYQDMCSRSV